MRAIAGASRNRQHEAGYAGLALVLILLIGGLAGTTFVPYALREKAARDHQREEENLEQLRRGLVAAIQRLQIIPDENSWVPAIAATLGLSSSAVAQALPGFPDDANTRRILLIDPRLDAGALPFTQTVAGATGPAACLTSRWSRVMLVSNTHRALSLPVAGGRPAPSDFDALWNWRYDERTRQPPAGWPAAWHGHAADLHVTRLRLDDLFHQITFENVNWSLNGSPLTTALLPESKYLLREGRLQIWTTNDYHLLNHVIRKDARFVLPSASLTNVNQPFGVASEIPTGRLIPDPGFHARGHNEDPGRDALAGLLHARGGAGPDKPDATKIQSLAGGSPTARRRSPPASNSRVNRAE